MSIAVRYHSRGGNTQKAAEAIANATGVKAESIDVPLAAPVDILFVGGGFYGGVKKGDIDSALKSHLETLDSETVKSIAAFSTAGGVDGAKRIAEIAEARGIKAQKETLPLKVGIRNHRTFFKTGSLTLNKKELALIENFVKSVIK